MKPVFLELFIKKKKLDDWCGSQDGSCPCSIIDTSESLKHQPNISTMTFFSSSPPSPSLFLASSLSSADKHGSLCCSCTIWAAVGGLPNVFIHGFGERMNQNRTSLQQKPNHLSLVAALREGEKEMPALYVHFLFSRLLFCSQFVLSVSRPRVSFSRFGSGVTTTHLNTGLSLTQDNAAKTNLATLSSSSWGSAWQISLISQSALVWAG